MSILDEIVAKKKTEVSSRKELYPVKLLEKSVFFAGETVSLCHYLRREDKQGIIAEIKRRSPSKGVINHHVSVEKLSIGYMQAGASALSVLTDNEYFGGSSADLETARRFNFCPILRKDFIVDEYQICESKSIGADAILLIAAVLSVEQIKSFTELAHSLGLEVLFEVHNDEELQSKFLPELDIVGVNNRNLKTFEVSIETSKELSEKIPSEALKISESGIDSAETIVELRNFGYEGFLIGESFMKTSRPQAACERFIREVRELRGE